MRKIICLTLAVIFVLLTFAGCSDSKQTQNEQSNQNSAGFENISLNKDLAEISELNNIVKIDSITPGLDTYSFDTVIFDLEKNQQLCHASFPEGAWVSGLTENGFYAIDTLKKELKIYDKNGKTTKEQSFSDVSEPFNFCALSENEKYFLYSNTSGTEITVVDLSDNSKRGIETAVPLRDTLSFKGDILRAVSINGEVFEIDVKKPESKLLIVDNRLKLYSSNYCLGETETNFLLANEYSCLYIPFSSVAEIVVGIFENGFATVTNTDNKYLLRFYDLNEKKISYYKSDDPVESICLADNDKVVAVVGSPMEKKHKIVIFKPNSPENLTVLSEDTVVVKNPSSDSATITATPKVIIENVPVISQFPEYPTGCESVSTVMALKYAGYNISAEEFITRFLPMSREFYMENGQNRGPSPYEYFIGNPKSPSSYGCMAPVIQKAVTSYIGDTEKIKDLTNMSLNEICEQYINQNIPVIMWATIKMLETNPKNSWYLSDGKRFTWPSNEHCMLLVGYDDENYYFNDPYQGKLVAFNKKTTEDRFAELGSQALAVMPQ